MDDYAGQFWKVLLAQFGAGDGDGRLYAWSYLFVQRLACVSHGVGDPEF